MAHESYGFSDLYDEALLPLLKTADPSKNNFIVIHIMGSHIYYNDRYPHEFSKWKKGPNPEGIEAYANSQLYTDWLLQQIYTYGKDNLIFKLWFISLIMVKALTSPTIQTPLIL